MISVSTSTHVVVKSKSFRLAPEAVKTVKPGKTLIACGLSAVCLTFAVSRQSHGPVLNRRFHGPAAGLRASGLFLFHAAGSEKLAQDHNSGILTYPGVSDIRRPNLRDRV